ncbi:hypothetical protein TNCT_618111 [Trichonephila clavata]|uniref:Secreted protein n=1 Tax=Trichonephila clavata TaxID=2740835 RepID=A0A8X6J553_TRICU|nr:hypothetical protein TNCT_618111 [Trichonephila clavata]
MFCAFSPCLLSLIARIVCGDRESLASSCFTIDVNRASIFCYNKSISYHTERPAPGLRSISILPPRNVANNLRTCRARTLCFVDVGHCCYRRMSHPELVLNHDSYVALLHHVLKCFQCSDWHSYYAWTFPLHIIGVVGDASPLYWLVRFVEVAYIDYR